MAIPDRVWPIDGVYSIVSSNFMHWLAEVTCVRLNEHMNFIIDAVGDSS